MRTGIFPVLNFCGGLKILYNALLEKETSGQYKRPTLFIGNGCFYMVKICQ